MQVWCFFLKKHWVGQIIYLELQKPVQPYQQKTNKIQSTINYHQFALLISIEASHSLIGSNLADLPKIEFFNFYSHQFPQFSFQFRQFRIMLLMLFILFFCAFFRIVFMEGRFMLMCVLITFSLEYRISSRILSLLWHFMDIDDITSSIIQLKVSLFSFLSENSIVLVFTLRLVKYSVSVLYISYFSSYSFQLESHIDDLSFIIRLIAQRRRTALKKRDLCYFYFLYENIVGILMMSIVFSRSSIYSKILILIQLQTIVFDQNKSSEKCMKNFRSSKTLKPVDPTIKQQANLRMKVKILQEQVQMLQKSNLNIFIPITQHAVHETVDYQSIINKLRQQVLALEQQNHASKNQVKKLERQKTQLKLKLQKEIQQKMSKISALQKANQQIQKQLQNIQQQYENKVKECQQLDKKIIEKNVELKFMHEDLYQQRIRKQSLQKQLKNIKNIISQVIYSSRIYKSLQIKCICIEKQQYDSLKNKIAELQNKIREMIQAGKRQKITLGTKKNDIGEQIVRLKKNIDTQLGIQGDSKHSQQFLKIYKSTHQLFNELIQKCQLSS